MVNIENFQESIMLVESTKAKQLNKYFEIQRELLKSSKINSYRKIKLENECEQIKSNISDLNCTIEKILDTFNTMKSQGMVW